VRVAAGVLYWSSDASCPKGSGEDIMRKRTVFSSYLIDESAFRCGGGLIGEKPFLLKRFENLFLIGGLISSSARNECHGRVDTGGSERSAHSSEH
jgi:hypothetical protein